MFNSRFRCIFSLLIVSAIPFSALAGPSEKKIRIGISTALTGDASTFGIDEKNSLLFALEKLFPGRYEAIIEDDRCDPKVAASVAQKFTAIDKVDLVFASPCSGGVIAAAPIYEKAKIPVMVVCASAKTVAKTGDFVFRTFPSDDKAAGILAHHLAAKDGKVAMITEENEYPLGLEHDFLAAFPSDRSVIRENFQMGQTDLRSLALRIKQKAPTRLIFNPQTEQGFAVLLKSFRDIGFKPAHYGFYYPSSPALLDIAREDLEGIIFADTPAVEQALNDDGQKLYQEFRSQYGKINSVELVFASAFEGVRALLTAYQSGDDVRHYLYNNSFHGLFGYYHFDSDGEIVGPNFVLKTVKNGIPTLFDGASN